MIAHYQEDTRDFNRTFELYEDRLFLRFRPRSGQKQDYTFYLNELSPEPIEDTFRENAKRGFLVLVGSVVASMLLSMVMISLPEQASYQYRGLGMAATIGLVVAGFILFFRVSRMTQGRVYLFRDKERKTAFIIIKQGKQKAGFDAFVKQLDARINEHSAPDPL